MMTCITLAPRRKRLRHDATLATLTQIVGQLELTGPRPMAGQARPRSRPRPSGPDGEVPVFRLTFFWTLRSFPWVVLSVQRCVKERADATTAQHLRVLREANLLNVAREDGKVTDRTETRSRRAGAAWLAELAAFDERPARRRK